MKRNYLFTLLLGSLCVSCSSSGDESPVRIIWEMGANQVEPGCYDCTFHLINTGNKVLNADWTIYFNQLSAVVKSKPDAGVCVEHIASTYYKMFPIEEYAPLAPGDTLAVRCMFRRSLIKESNAPEGFYVVWKDAKGNEQHIRNVPLTVVAFDNPAQWSRKGVAELPYPSGERVYQANLCFDGVQDLQPTDIFPSLKEVATGYDNFTFSREINLNYDAALQQEGDLLRSKLQALGCTFAAHASLTINLLIGQFPDAPNDEYYTLDMKDYTVNIKGKSPHGVFNGAQTLLAILSHNTLPCTMKSVAIADYPDLTYRGLMLDVARNFTGKAHLLHLIDLLSSYKINVLHLHLTDDEGWRLEIPGLEELTAIGSVRGHTLDESQCLYPSFGGGWDAADTTSTANGHYSREDFIGILRYAKQRHIKIIPEVDLPGHARAAIKAMNARYNRYIATDPDKAKEYLLVDLNDKSEYLSVQFFKDNVIHVALPSVYTFVEKVVDEIVAMYEEAGVRPDVFHLGGDEVPHGAWEKSELSKAFMAQQGMTEIRALKDYFITQTLGILASRGLQLGAWQEVAFLPDRSVNPAFSDSNVLSYCWNIVPDWGGDDVPYRLANANYPVILCNASNLYMDFSYNKHEEEPGLCWGGFVNEYNSFNVLPYQVYYSVREHLSGDPIDIVTEAKKKERLKPSAAANIQGIQAQLWSETIRSYEMVQYYLFPKIYGLVERGWNATPAWSSDPEGAEYRADLKKYNAKIGQRELKRLATGGVHFRVSQPGIRIENGMLLINHPVPDVRIYYTTDGSVPDEHSIRWTEPVPCDASQIRAKAYCQGRWSVATRYKE